MSAAPSPSKANLAQGCRDASAVSPAMVSITKAQHIELVMQANYWKSLPARAVRREQWRHERFGHIVRQRGFPARLVRQQSWQEIVNESLILIRNGESIRP